MKQKGNNGYLLVFFAGVLWGTIGLFVKQLQRCGAFCAVSEQGCVMP